MYDALEELADLSEALQKDDITLATANRKIQRQLEVFSSRKESPGCFYKEAITAIAAGKFHGVPLSKGGKQEREINCKQFYQGLVDSMGARLLSDADKRFSNLVTVTQPESYQNPLSCSPDHGESELREMCIKFKLPFSTTKDAFREFKDSKGAIITQQFRKLLFAIDTIPVSTAACERGFSVMNGICTPNTFASYCSPHSIMHGDPHFRTTSHFVEPSVICQAVAGERQAGCYVTAWNGQIDQSANST